MVINQSSGASGIGGIAGGLSGITGSMSMMSDTQRTSAYNKFDSWFSNSTEPSAYAEPSGYVYDHANDPNYL